MSSSSFLFLIHVFCVFSQLMEAQSSRNINLGSFLSPLGPQISWLSSSGDFAFGFLPVVDDGSAARRFLLAIWFDKTDPKTVVWSAKVKRSAAIGEATLELKTDGGLVLTDAQNRVLWNTTGVSDDVSHAAMLDDGNFVLAGPDGSPLWQSFQHPTDTLLPGQSLLPGNKLRSMDAEHSHRRFELRLEANGSDLALYYITTQQTDSSYGFYWSVNTSNIATQLCFQQSGLRLNLMNESVISITSPSPETERDMYQRATLGDDGVFRHYAHPKNDATMGWKTVAYVPKGICKTVFTYGSGICGFNSYCIMDEDKVNCSCPQGYSYFDRNRKFGGCKQDFPSQSCEVDESSMFELKAMVNVDYPGSAYDHFKPMQEEECKQVCLTDCLCTAVIFWNSTTGDCWKKRHPMSNGRSGDFVNRTAYIKRPKGEGGGGGGGGSSLAGVATSWGYVMPQILVPTAKK